MKAIKKIVNIILILGMLISYFIPLNNIQASSNYSVKVVNSNGTTSTIGSYDNYNNALIAMRNHKSTEDNVAAIYNKEGQLINANYAMVKFVPGGMLSLYPSSTSKTIYTSIHKSYGSDAAFLDYDLKSNRVKLKISGFVGWADFGGDSKKIRLNEEFGRSKLRAQPTVKSAELTLVESGSVLDYTEVVSDIDKGPYIWYKVNYKGQIGYVAEKTNDDEEWITVLGPNLEIIPLSLLKSKSIKMNSYTKIYSSTSTSSSVVVNEINDGEVIPYKSKKTVGGYTWYNVTYNNKTGWIRKSNNSTTEVNYTLSTLYQAWTTGNLLHYFEHQINGSKAMSYNNVAHYPSFMNSINVYYSFDGNYFYNSLKDMLDDYKSNTYNKALNKNSPHYPYYMYLPTHSKTGYRAEDFDQQVRNKGYTKNKDYNIEYYNFNNDTGKLVAIPGVSRANISLLYGTGKYFVNAANTYGINPLMMFSTAVNESAFGTSAIAFYKNNLFGLGAFDSNPVVSARSYKHVKDSIFDYAEFTGDSNSSYSNPNNIYYFGSHYGNKGSGMNVKYATDPYWGEKQAEISYNTDLGFGMQDYLANTIGVTTKENVNMYKKPDGKNIIYTLKNNNLNLSVNNIPLIVFDKIKGNDNKYWYKVYSDVSLDTNQNININSPYMFERSYGYIKEEDLYVSNNQPVISADDIVIKQGEKVDLLKNVKAIDVEDGDITSKIQIIGEVDTNIVGDHSITYFVEDSSRFQSSKEINIYVKQSGLPVIIANDRTISEYDSFDPLIGVSANDYVDGDITSNIEVIENYVNTSKTGVYKVVYKVMNSSGKSVEKEITVTVVPNESPVINATNKTITVGDKFDPLIDVTAHDKEDGVITNIEVIVNEVDVNKAGVYKVVYKVIDSANNEVTKEIKVTVEEINYTNKKGEFYFEKMNYNTSKDKLEVAGYLAIKGVNNTPKDDIKYDLIFKNNFDNSETIKPLSRWLTNHPNRSYNDGVYNYSATWFKGDVDLSDLEKGEYTLYVRARLNEFQTISLFRNVLGKDMTRKASGKNGEGYLFRNNNYKKDYPIELFVNKKGLISTTTPPHSSNMFNNYKTVEFNGKYLNIVGTSYNINGNYNTKSNIERQLIFENSITEERYYYDIGSFVGSNIPLRLDDGKSKVRGWFDTKNKVDISKIPVGNYVIYVRTKTGNIDDHGELNDIFLRKIDANTINGNRHYSFTLNKSARFRLELNVKNI